MLVLTDRQNTPTGVALLHPDDVATALAYRWTLTRGGYVITFSCGRAGIYLHRLLMRAPAELQVDHINGVRHDNRRSNLRLVSQTDNNLNRHKATSKTGHLNVYTSVDGGFRVVISHRHLGHFSSLTDAIACRDEYRRANSLPPAPQGPQ